MEREERRRKAGEDGRRGEQQDDARASLQRVLVDDVRTLAYRTQHLAHAFAEQQAMHPTASRRVVHVLQAETGGELLTAGAWPRRSGSARPPPRASSTGSSGRATCSRERPATPDRPAAGAPAHHPGGDGRRRRVLRPLGQRTVR